MKKIKSLSVLAFALLAGAALRGQNINPTIEVTNIYQGKSSEIHKPQQKMNIPDSLLRFDLDFDYEVFDKPYEGAYSFKPYMLNIRPGKDAYRGRSLYLKAGAGYSLHPQLEFVFSPEQDSPFQMSVYASHKSYFGKYYDIVPEQDGDVLKLSSSGDSFNGYETLTTAGFDGRYSWDKAVLSFGIGYYGLASKDTLVKRSYNGLDFNVRVSSNNDSDSYFFYDAGLKGRIASDIMDYDAAFTSPDIPVGKSRLSENGFVLDGCAGPVFNASNRLLVGFEASTYSYSNLFESGNGRLAVIPKYEFSKGRWDISLGLRLEAIVKGSQADTLNFGSMNEKKGNVIYPDARVSFTASDNVSIYAKAKGGSDQNPYSSLIASNHHLTPSYSLSTVLMDNSITAYDFSLGVQGNIASRLQFDVNGGCAGIENGLLDGVSVCDGEKLLPCLAYQDYDLMYANLLLSWKSKNLTIDAGAHYRNTIFPYENDDSQPVPEAFELPELSGSLRAVLDISPRIYAGLKAEAATSRNGKFSCGDVRVPGYVDLGCLGGYQFNRKFGLWAEAGNLLGMNIQKNPTYSEKGPWATLGITLNL